MPLLCTLIIVLFTACFPHKANAENKFKVGMILPLSGDVSDYGVSIQNSISLGIKDHPEKFTNIKFIYDDVQYDTKLAISSLNNMRGLQKIDLAVTWGIPFCKALAPLAERRHIPLIGLCIDPETSKGRSYVMLFMNVTYDFIEKQIAFLNQNNLKKVALLVSDNAYLFEMQRAFQMKITSDFSVTYIDGLPSTEKDFRTHIIKLKQNSYDAVGVFLSIGQAPLFYRQSAQLKFDIPTFGTNLFESHSEIRAGERSMDGAVFTNTKINPDFKEKYKSEFGIDSQLAFGAPAYELAMTIGNLFNHIDEKLTPEQIMEKFHSIGEQRGTASGPWRVIKSNEYGTYVQFPIAVKEIKGMGYRELLDQSR
jgi:ABC-type branched-subunit amino acid transport system substrate-binding protein